MAGDAPVRLEGVPFATLYGVTTGNLNKAVKRNQQRFPSDFMFPLSDEEGHDQAIRSLFDAIRQLMAPPAKPHKQIGFHVKEPRSPPLV